MTTSMNDPSTRHAYCRVLTIAGSDSGGGAGIQADLKTFAALGCYGMSAVTALTAQNTQGVAAIHPVPTDFIRAQIAAVVEDIGVDAVKIGMLFSPALIETVADALKRYQIATVVLDPVMVAQSGDKLLQDDAIDAIRSLLVPLATVVTPNLPEAEVLLDRSITDMTEMRAAMPALMRLGSSSVLLKGGHLKDGTGIDLLYLGDEKRLLTMEAETIDTRNTHGTGCTLSSAIAAHLAKGGTVESAVRKAKAYITEAIRAGAGYTLGRGHGPVHHFHRYW